jgi:lysophospholipid hydrolase
MASQLTNLSRIVERAADYPITSFLACLVVLILTYFWYCCCNKRYFTRRIDLSEDTPAPSRPMRKRDIMRHLGKRVIRVGGSRLRDLRRRSSLTFRFQPPPNSSEIQLHKEPPAAYLEADIEIDSQIPHDVMYLLKSVRVFGHFEKPLFMQLCKHVETKFVPAGAILFRPGQVDDSIYVVQNGKLNVFLVEQDGSELPLKEAGTGDSVHSLLSLLDAIVGQPHPFKSVAARAIRDTYVLQYVTV